MTITFTLDGHQYRKENEEPWTADDTRWADWMNALQEIFYLKERGNYFPFPIVAFVRELAEARQLEDLKIEDWRWLSFPDVVY